MRQIHYPGAITIAKAMPCTTIAFVVFVVMALDGAVGFPAALHRVVTILSLPVVFIAYPVSLVFLIVGNNMFDGPFPTWFFAVSFPFRLIPFLFCDLLVHGLRRTWVTVG